MYTSALGGTLSDQAQLLKEVEEEKKGLSDLAKRVRDIKRRLGKHG